MHVHAMPMCRRPVIANTLVGGSQLCLWRRHLGMLLKVLKENGTPVVFTPEFRAKLPTLNYP